ncbi:MKRN2 opposite strand protein-like [Anopheles cruzii]|uniref:MKRN2 opposite strand protein-like n=1 Tax=Anopheles cruzii TaxID=68878 RepID=UPI0022EC1DAC|nr:MKRN2 opposite strand protein-like [Anopheles cruzii]XP_052871216.1 MKRN2 opposite strand protein-like [Anopheles cruzii]
MSTWCVMRMERDLICFRHCGETIFVYQTLSSCPLCGDPLSSDLDDSPLTLPCPFIRASQHPCAIVLRPSRGDFLSSFQNQENLHIALTSLSGDITEYDTEGLVETSAKNSDDWNQCLLVAQVPEGWYDRWEEVLAACSDRCRWSKDTYHEASNNCYTFVLSFLVKLGYEEFSAYCHDKFLFSEQYIVPKTQNAAKFITIHRKLQSCGYWIDEQQQ